MNITRPHTALLITLLVVLIALAGGATYLVWRNGMPASSPSVTTPNTSQSTPSPTTKPTPQQPSQTTTKPVRQTVKLYMIRIGDGTAKSGTIGCGDTLTSISKTMTTATPLKDSLKELFAIKQSRLSGGAYNALWQSSLSVKSASIVNKKATVHLSGTTKLSGTCDIPRVKAQLESTAKQFASVDSVQFYINDKTLDEALSLK